MGRPFTLKQREGEVALELAIKTERNGFCGSWRIRAKLNVPNRICKKHFFKNLVLFCWLATGVESCCT